MCVCVHASIFVCKVQWVVKVRLCEQEGEEGKEDRSRGREKRLK